jgi:P27 family predicted phage terminase small subunit
MGQRGKKSAAELSVVPVLGDARMAAPSTLTPDEASVWKGIVDSLPPDWFRPSDEPILAAYCQTAAQYEKATEELRAAPLTLTAENGRVYRHPLLTVQHTAALRLAALAGKLRLCPSSRYDHKKAFTAGKTLPGKKPWQYGER